MKVLLDHMLGKKVKVEMENAGHEVYRAIELSLHEVTNGDLYQYCIDNDFILVTCDSDFDTMKIGRNGESSIIYLKPYPTTSLEFLLPLIRKQIPKIDVTLLTNHLIVIEEETITYLSF